MRVVGTAADGAPRDLAIVDIFLRGGSGFGVIEAARRCRPGAALAVPGNHATGEMRARCLSAGADRLFDKSCEIDQLVAFRIALARGGAAAAH